MDDEPRLKNRSYGRCAESMTRGKTHASHACSSRQYGIIGEVFARPTGISARGRVRNLRRRGNEIFAGFGGDSRRTNNKCNDNYGARRESTRPASRRSARGQWGARVWVTYVDEIRQVVDEVLVYRRVRRLQAQDVLVSRLERLQLRLLVFALPLKGDC